MLVMGFFLSISSFTSATLTSVNKIQVTPDQPTQKSEVIFSIDITGDNIEEVWIEVEECTDPESDNYFCHPKYNVSATNVNGVWQVNKTLLYTDTAEGHCWPVIKSNGTWFDFKNDKTKWTNFTVIPAEDDTNGNGANGANDDNDSNSTPGFGIILIVISLIAVLFIYKRKRMK